MLPPSRQSRRPIGATETDAVPTGPQEQRKVRGFTLRVISGPDAGAVHHARGPHTVVGTHRSCDLVLSDPTVSRFHTELSMRDGETVLRDLGSKNGTKAADVRLQQATLTADVVLTLGATQLGFRFKGEEIQVPYSMREGFGSLLGRSDAMRLTFTLLERAAASDATVLLDGETGTGKDSAAESIHLESPRRDAPFVVVDCASLSPQLAEAELFGHEKGAFTGADRQRLGAFERAHTGTLFLDEIGELPQELQPKLLRAIESRTIQRVGGTLRIPLDLRIIAATSRDLRAEANAGAFRSDLYFRLAVLCIRLPRLADRLEDLPLLVAALLEEMGMKDSEAGRALLGRDGLARLRSHPWAGNIRELRNHVERAVALGGAELPAAAPGEGAPPVDISRPLRLERDRFVGWFERRYLSELLRAHEDNVARSARVAGMDRAHFHRLLARAGLR